MSQLFFLVLARDRRHVVEKIEELKKLGVSYKIVCGERLDLPNVVYREPKGKYDAINFGASLIPKDVDVVVMNDVDTRIHNFERALEYSRDEGVALVFGTEMVLEGPQKLFFRFLNPIRKKIPVAASGELMLVKRKVLEEILPVKACKAEDTYIMFKVLEGGGRVVFSEEFRAETERTKTPEKEEDYKRRTVAGIYQALSFTHPPILVRLFYTVLPLASPFLLILGDRGYYWMRGILLGLSDFIHGDESGSWQTTYLDR